MRPEDRGEYELLMEKQLGQGSRSGVNTIVLLFKVAPFSTVPPSTLSASGLIMQQATYWFNIAKWEEETREKAAKASQLETEISISTDDAHHNGSREFIIAVRDAKNDDGSKKYPLHVRMNTHVTKVTFDEAENPPRATGMESLEREHLYKASPMSKSALPVPPSHRNQLEEMAGELERLNQDLSDIQTEEEIDAVEEQKIWSQVC
ncbi:hypothetical protein N7519_005578 [Penicillium mononematosum]|uniref:uncharacterized protein n=1 Tax=Penicillium mononematosum TaxID=268346 RepID=UPI00254804D6|nr:uncharacterized protein N7519_005578 [Penicillium mononematosum]KAJ6184277.1 hypothetical protein N7519_005578 [Penicillium mononematosum]